MKCRITYSNREIKFDGKIIVSITILPSFADVKTALIYILGDEDRNISYSIGRVISEQSA